LYDDSMFYRLQYFSLKKKLSMIANKV